MKTTMKPLDQDEMETVQEGVYRLQKLARLLVTTDREDVCETAERIETLARMIRLGLQ